MICTEPLFSSSFAYKVNSKGLFDTHVRRLIADFHLEVKLNRLKLR
jgi:hypothetical protein